MLLSSWIKPVKNATVIEWKKTKSVMTTLSMSSNPLFFLMQLGIWFTASYFIRWYMAYTAGVCFEQASRVKCVAACVWLWKQTNSSLKWTSKVVSYHHFLQGGHLSRATVINISNSGLKELSLTLLSRANCSMRSGRKHLQWPYLVILTSRVSLRRYRNDLISGTVLRDTIALISDCKVVGRELGENSTPPPPPLKPSHSDIRHSTNPVHALKDLKMANMWTVFLNTSGN